MNLVQEVGKTLHLVHDHPAGRIDGSELGRKQTRIGKEGLIGGLGEQIHEMGIGKYGPQPGALA